MQSLLAGVLSGRYILIFLKGFDKIAQIIKPAGIGDICHCLVGGGQQIGRMLNPLVIQIIHRRPVRQLLKKAAEVFRRHMGGRGQLLQRNRILVVGVDKFQHIFQLVNFFMVAQGLRRLLIIQMGSKDQAKQLVKSAIDSKLVTGGLLLKGSEDPVNDRTDIRAFPVKMMEDQRPVVDDLLDIGLTGRIVL